MLAVLATAALGLSLLLPGGALQAQDSAIEYPENGKDPVATFTADDPEGATSVTWGVLAADATFADIPGVDTADAADAEDFEIDKDGVLKFMGSPDFENPMGGANSACDVTASPNPCTNTYNVVVTATDPGEDPETGYHKVTVKVTNVDEPGKATWTVDPDGTDDLVVAEVNGGDPIVQFQVGATLTASVTDGDIAGTAKAVASPSASAPIWRWYRSPSATATGTLIDDANTNAYTVGLNDVGMYIRVVAHYVVAGNVDQETAPLTSDFAVLAARVGDHELEFDPNEIEFSVAEGKKGAIVGAVTATGNHGVINYSLGDAATGDNAKFEIDQETGQITTLMDLDYEGVDAATADAVGSCAGADGTTPDRDCEVTITATDASGQASAPVANVTIKITNVDEKPVFSSGYEAASVAEGTTVIDTNADTDDDSSSGDSVYTASDPEGRNLTYHLLGPDGAKFKLSSARVLSFRTAPDYEKPTDANGDNVYEVTVRASDGTMNADRMARVTVTGVPEPPVIAGRDSINFAEGGKGSVATFTADDPEGATSITWSIPQSADPDDTGSLTAVHNADFASFDINDEDGILTFVSPPDFENPPATNATNNTYRVVVAATDAATDGETGYHSVTVKVTNVNERGEVAWTIDPDGTDGPLAATVLDSDSTPIMQFQVGATLVASATDGDIAGEAKEVGSAQEVTWRWYRGSTAIPDEELNTYTVKLADARSRIRVVATYRVGGSDTQETAALTSDYAVLAKRVAPNALKFDPPSVSREVAESEKGANVGAPVTATGNHGVVNYTLVDGGDATKFDIDQKTGQITTMVDLDYDAADTGTDLADNCRDADFCTVTVRATDASGQATGTAQDDPPVFNDATVTIKVTNVDEKPDFSSADPAIGMTAIRVAEGSAALTAEDNVANVTYAATDQDGLNVNLTLMGPDAAKFTLSSSTDGSVLAFRAKPDYEMPSDANRDNRYEVTVRASDGTLYTDRAVIVTVTDDNEAPAIIAGGLVVTGPTSVSLEENTTAVATYTAAGPDKALATWSLSGDDAGDFDIPGGVLTFKSSPDYEAPADADTDNVYEVTVKANDGTNADERDVTVAVTNMDEDGEVTLSSATPVVDTAITASLTDPDTSVTGESWQWSRSMAMDGAFADISGATAMSYTPTAADDGYYLQATVTYTDGHGGGKTAMAVADSQVTSNRPPMFADATASREVAENTGAGMNVGSPVVATDPDGDRLAYSLEGADASAFTIDDMGQIQVGAGTMLDYETKSSYMVMVKAEETDPHHDFSATIAVTIMVTNVGLDNKYDANDNGEIDKAEVIQGIRGHFMVPPEVTKAEVIELIRLYFNALLGG